MMDPAPSNAGKFGKLTVRATGRKGYDHNWIPFRATKSEVSQSTRSMNKGKGGFARVMVSTPCLGNHGPDPGEAGAEPGGI